MLQEQRVRAEIINPARSVVINPGIEVEHSARYFELISRVEDLEDLEVKLPTRRQEADRRLDLKQTGIIFLLPRLKSNGYLAPE